MKWHECVTARAVHAGDHLERVRWPAGSDFNCEPAQFTISDVTGGIGWLWTWPGDWAVNQALDSPDIAQFFEWDGTPFVGTAFSWLLSPALAFLLILALASIADALTKAFPKRGSK